MSLNSKLEVNSCETVSDLVQNISDESGIEEKELWHVVTDLVLNDSFLESAENETRLRFLFELHLGNVVTSWDYTGNPPARWVEITIPIDGVEDSDFTFSYGAFNIPMHKNDQYIDAMKKLAEDEGLEIGHQDDDVVFTEHQEYGPTRAIKLTGRILDEVYGLDFRDVIHAKKVVPGSENTDSTW